LRASVGIVLAQVRTFLHASLVIMFLQGRTIFRGNLQNWACTDTPCFACIPEIVRAHSNRFSLASLKLSVQRDASFGVPPCKSFDHADALFVASLEIVRHKDERFCGRPS
jgi:hypothetical protein